MIKLTKNLVKIKRARLLASPHMGCYAESFFHSYDHYIQPCEETDTGMNTNEMSFSVAMVVALLVVVTVICFFFLRAIERA